MWRTKNVIFVVTGIAIVAVFAGFMLGRNPQVIEQAADASAKLRGQVVTTVHAEEASEALSSPVKAVQERGVYYPGTEDLAPDEMRVIACGSGMPMPRLKQAAACFLIELGNGDKFIFDMGTGSMERIYALGIQLDYIDKVFLTHLHMDHMGDLPAFYIYGPQNNRSVPLRVWGPGGGGTRPEWGTKAALEHVEKTWAWMTGTLAGTIDTRSFSLEVT
ncbi:MAG: MBL fold metallo-hydrolase, partial [bacterium]|nr:MBL fold metallo-hydrolase [bacterium]